MKAFYSLLLLMAVTLTACDETITEKFLQLADGTSTSLVFNADENTEATIKFTADAAWTASVSEVAASKSGESISWLKLSAYGGEAGDCTITASITRNYTGASRKAEIKIVCGDSEIVITVEQKGETSAGTVAKKIKKIVYTEEDNSAVDEGHTPYEYSRDMEFSYYDDGTVARITMNDVDEYDYETTTIYSFNYDVVGEIQMEEKELGESGETYNYVIKLDDRGNATELRSSGNSRPMATFGYTNDVRLAKVEAYDEYSDGSVDYRTTFDYENGMITKISDFYGYDTDTYELDDTYYTNKYPNNGMIDMMAYMVEPGEDDDLSILFYIGCLGKTSDYLLEKSFIMDDALIDANGEIDYEYCNKRKNPGEKIETVEYTSVEHSEGPSPIEYEFDADGNVTKIIESTSYKVYKGSYEIWTTNEKRTATVWNPYEEKEETMTYYETETKNETSKYVKSGKDSRTYTISY
ncbi:MAG: hypothetical protein H9802_01270 [Candidatus Phocaeicola faecipullorum]|nr:hypothetical protein [Candidatus Phocaeicola faecipullorum]